MRKSLPLFAVLSAAVLLLIAVPSLLRAEEPVGGEQVAPEHATLLSTVVSKFTYQGLLRVNGSPVTGPRDMVFRLHADATCTSQVGSAIVKNNVAVTDGLFAVGLEVDPTHINGQALWLEVEVGGTPIGCEEIVSVPYALSLRPGALISGPVGIRVEASDTDGYGGYFANTSISSVGPDVVLGDNASNDEGNLWSSPAEPSSDIYLRSNDEVWIELDENDDEDATFRVRNGTNTTVFSVNENGDTVALGTKSALIQTQAQGQRAVYAVESPEVWLEDFGAAQLVEGTATITVDPIFAEMANLSTEYHVFVTPVDGWAALYVSNKAEDSFEVRAADGQGSIAFDYRIVAKRRGYEERRLEAVPQLEFVQQDAMGGSGSESDEPSR